MTTNIGNLPARAYDETTTADPRTSPGLARTIGDRVYYSGNCYVKTGTADTDWEKITQGCMSGGLLTVDFFRQRAAALAGLGRGGEFFESFNHFEADPLSGTDARPVGWWNFNKAAAGQYTMPEPHVWRAASGATASGAADSLTYAPHLVNMSTQPWYFAMRFKLPLAAGDAQARMVVALSQVSSGNECRFGYSGASASTTTYTAYYDTIGTPRTVDTGVGIDNAWHYFEAWMLPVSGGGDGRLRISLDQAATVVSATTMSSATDENVRLARYCRNGTTTTSRQIDVNWIMLDYPHK